MSAKIILSPLNSLILCLVIFFIPFNIVQAHVPNIISFSTISAPIGTIVCRSEVKTTAQVDSKALVDNLTLALKAQRFSLVTDHILKKPERKTLLKTLNENDPRKRDIPQDQFDHNMSNQLSEIKASFQRLLEEGNQKNIFWESIELISFGLDSTSKDNKLSPKINIHGILITYGIANTNAQFTINLTASLEINDRWYLFDELAWIGFDIPFSNEENEQQKYLKSEAEKYPIAELKPALLRPSEQIIWDVLQLFDKTLNQETILNQSALNESRTKDEQLMELFQLVDSLSAINAMNDMDTAIYAVARHLETFSYQMHYSISQALIKLKKYNESAFLLHVGVIRMYQDQYARKDEKQYIGMTLNPEMGGNLFMVADISNWIYVMNKAIDFCREQDIAMYPDHERALISYYKRPITPTHRLIYVNEGNELNQSYNWSRKIRPRTEERVNRQRAEYASKFAFQEGKTIAGTWYSKDKSWSFRADGSGSYQNFEKELSGAERNDFTYEVDYSKYPVIIKTTFNNEFYTNESSGFIHTILAEFFSDTVVKIGPRGNEIFNQNEALIYVKEKPGEKTFTAVEMPKRTTYLPAKQEKLSKKELKQFWKDNIQQTLDKDSLIRESAWPENINSIPAFPRKFKDFMAINQLANMSIIMRDLTYDHIEQVKLDDGQIVLMIYFLGKKFFENEHVFDEEWTWTNKDNYHEKGSFEAYGLLFAKIDGTWQIVNYSEWTSTGSLDDIKAAQNYLINGAVYNLALDRVLNKTIKKIISPDVNEMAAQIQFPLNGNWGNAIGLTGDSSSWSKNVFMSNLYKLFTEEIKESLSEAYSRQRIKASGTSANGNLSTDYTEMFGPEDWTITNGKKVRAIKRDHAIQTFNLDDKPLTFTIERIPDLIDLNNKRYEVHTTLEFGKVDTKWRLVSYDWEARERKARGSQKEEKVIPTKEELKQFWDDNILAIISYDKEKIANQTTYPFTNHKGGSTFIDSKESFVESENDFIPQEFRDVLNSLSVDDLKVGFYQPKSKHKVNGIYVDEPTITTLFIQLGEYNDEGLTFKKINNQWLLACNGKCYD